MQANEYGRYTTSHVRGKLRIHPYLYVASISSHIIGNGLCGYVAILNAVKFDQETNITWNNFKKLTNFEGKIPTQYNLLTSIYNINFFVTDVTQKTELVDSIINQCNNNQLAEHLNQDEISSLIQKLKNIRSSVHLHTEKLNWISTYELACVLNSLIKKTFVLWVKHKGATTIEASNLSGRLRIIKNLKIKEYLKLFDINVIHIIYYKSHFDVLTFHHLPTYTAT